MTKRDYVAMAKILKATSDRATAEAKDAPFGPAYESGGHTAVRRIANAFAEMAAIDNPRFDRDRFFDAVGF